MQDVDYTYNERGWLLSSTAPLFADTLYYNKYQQGLTPQFNGNIAGQRWTTDMVASNQVLTKKQFVNSFAYTYDPLNRLTLGITGDSAYAEYGIRYDKGGNILALNRIFDHDLVDSLSYNYTSASDYTNQLQSLSDDARSEMPDAHAPGTFGYTYDGNGNMTADSSKHISIIYNLLNLPMSVSRFRFPGELITGNSTIGSYIYDANGDKLVSTSSTDTSSIINYYIDGIQYTGNGAQPQLSFMQTEEGRMFPYSTDTSAYYQYYLTDHLGNTRVAFDNAGGELTVNQQDDYLPFGMEINRSLAGSPKNEYLYNRKELQENTQLYDYGARLYDPVIARWTTIDPLAEKSRRWSPYNYGVDNSIRNIDPDGMFTIDGADKNVNGGNATYNKDKDGNITWINATEATQKIGNDMLKTSIGTQKLDDLIASDVKTKLVDNTTEIKKDEKGSTTLGEQIPTSYKVNAEGKMVTASQTITIYEKAIESVMNGHQWVDYNKRTDEVTFDFRKYSKDEHIGAVGTHEATHGTDPQSSPVTNRGAPTSETEKLPYQNQRLFYKELDNKKNNE